MIFQFYIGAMAVAVLLSMFNLRVGDSRLPSLAINYSLVIIVFHVVVMTWWGLGWKDEEFYLLVAAAQGIISYMAYETGCRAARIIMPLSWMAVFGNLETFILHYDYPHQWYFWGMNVIQCAQIASLAFASSLFSPIHQRMHWRPRKNTSDMKRIVHERAG